MEQPRTMLSSLFWLFLIFLFGAGVTWAVFSVFIPGPERGMTYYFVLSLIIAAEFVVFIHLANPGTRAGGKASSPATRYMAQGGIFVWFILTLIVAVFALSPDRADTAAADKILIIDLVLLFFLFVFLYAIYSKDFQVGEVSHRLADERANIQFDIPALESVLRFTTDIGRQYAEHAATSDRVGKKVDTVRSGIDGVMVSERAVLQGKGADWSAKIQEQIAQLVGYSDNMNLSSDQALEALNNIAGQADTILATLRQRERAITS